MKDAVSFRTRKSSIYDKKSNVPFKISRSKFFNFLSCKRCFYLDRVKGLKEPSMPGWALNIAVDELLRAPRRSQVGVRAWISGEAQSVLVQLASRSQAEGFSHKGSCTLAAMEQSEEHSSEYRVQILNAKRRVGSASE